jgi:4-diphosphocytidyl-2-C-methyl-D-erythritol kinase
VNTLTLPAPAKLNLFLHITGQRPDGYHLLQTHFQLLDYGDTLHFSTTEGSQIHLDCSLPSLNSQNNLVFRAANALKVRTSSTHGVSITLEKKLPLGGGLGGGSSNAATTLLALNSLWNCGLGIDELAEIGVTLGADVPVFVKGHTAWAEGIGEKLVPLPVPERWYVVLTPHCAASTAEIFCHPELTKHTSIIRIPAFPILGSKNDCEQVACRLYPEIREAINWLNQYSQAIMTGTGASLFAAFGSKAEAERVLAQKPDQVEGFVARGINQSPVHRLLKLK